MRRLLNIAAVVTAVGLLGCTPGPRATSDPPGTGRQTVEVTRQDLLIREEHSGWLGYGDAVDLVAGRDGIVTWLPQLGATIGRGHVLAEIDGIGTRLLSGERPAWRRLEAGVPDGPDAQQLNDNLAALGYAPRDALPDARFDWRTRDAVSRWQRDLGVTRTGAVELGDVAFHATELRIATIEAPPGTRVSAGQALATATALARVVTVAIDATRPETLTAGQSVVVVLPDRTELDATVWAVGREAATGAADAAPTLTAAIVSPSLTGELDTGPVRVVVEQVVAPDALTVPVAALVAHAGGGYAVERVTPRGAELVTVEPGRFAEGLVAVTGDVAEGDSVVVPS